MLPAPRPILHFPVDVAGFAVHQDDQAQRPEADQDVAVRLHMTRVGMGELVAVVIVPQGILVVGEVILQPPFPDLVAVPVDLAEDVHVDAAVIMFAVRQAALHPLGVLGRGQFPRQIQHVAGRGRIQVVMLKVIGEFPDDGGILVQLQNSPASRREFRSVGGLAGDQDIAVIEKLGVVPEFTRQLPLVNDGAGFVEQVAVSAVGR